MTKLTVKSDCTTYTIPIHIEYACWECHDRKMVITGQYDNIEEVKCPFCN